MKICRIVLLCFALILCSTGYVSAKERKADSRIVSVSLFKNGIVIVKQEINISGNGSYRLDDIPMPIHGTYWIESDAKVITRVTKREVEDTIPAEAMNNFQQSLSGKKVTIFFKKKRRREISGTVLKVDYKTASTVDRNSYFRPRYNSYGGMYGNSMPSPPRDDPNFLILRSDESGGGYYYLDVASISYIKAEEEEDKGPVSIKRQVPALIFNVTEGGYSSKIWVTYLTKGLSWIPSYRINITDDEKLELIQKSVIKNELMKLDNVEIQLISGYPNIPLSHINSPVNPNVRWSDFFRSVNSKIPTQHNNNYSMMSQHVVRFNEGHRQESDIVPTDLPGESSDIYYHSIGHYYMLRNDALIIETSREEIEFDRIVEWVIPNTRHANGRYITEGERNHDPEKYESVAWNAVRFRNPFSFPMTTAAAVIEDKGYFQGQTMSYWTNPGQKAILRTTKALSIVTRSIEHEMEKERDVIYFGGRHYRKIWVRGEIEASNFRGRNITMLIKREFSGNLLEADEKPKCNLMEEGVSHINKRNELVWEIELKPGATRKLTYKYEILVPH